MVSLKRIGLGIVAAALAFTPTAAQANASNSVLVEGCILPYGFETELLTLQDTSTFSIPISQTILDAGLIEEGGVIDVTIPFTVGADTFPTLGTNCLNALADAQVRVRYAFSLGNNGPLVFAWNGTTNRTIDHVLNLSHVQQGFTMDHTIGLQVSNTNGTVEEFSQYLYMTFYVDSIDLTNVLNNQVQFDLR